MQASSQIIPPSAAPRSEATQNGAAAQASRPGHGELSIGGSTSAEQAVQFAQLADRREDAELEQAALKQRQQLPKNIKGFRQHPLYVLKRHIGKYQGLKPGTAPLGLHRGEPYYDRSALSDLHSASKWKRHGREVLPGELGQPCKLIKHGKKGGKAEPPGQAGPSQAAGAADGAEDNTAEVQCPCHVLHAYSRTANHCSTVHAVSVPRCPPNAPPVPNKNVQLLQ